MEKPTIAEKHFAKLIAMWHGAQMIYRDRNGMQTVASSHGYGHWGDSPERYAAVHWQEYVSAAQAVLSQR